MKRIHVFVYVRIRARWIGPYAWRGVSQPISLVFATLSQSVCNVIGNSSATFWQSVRNVLAIRQQCFGKPSAMFWQTVRSRRGRFIVPAYMKTPTKWRTEMRVRWFEYTYLIMWKHIFGYGNTRFCLLQDTARWIGPLRLAECSQPISWVFATLSQTVSSIIANRSPRISCVFVAHSLLEYYVFVK